MMNFPAWTHEADDATLNRRFGASTVARGRQYANLGRVGAIQVSGHLATAPVRGSGYRSYVTSVSAASGIGSLRGTCSCPVRQDCKHCVALILTMRSPENHHTAPTWQQVLAPFNGTGTGSGHSLGLQVDDEGSSPTLRAVRRGTRGNWVRGGASWDDLARSSSDFAPDQRDALLALLATRPHQPGRSRTDALPLGELPPSAWLALRRAVGAGVVLLPGTSLTGRDLPDPVLVGESYVPIVRVASGQDGALRIDPMVETAEFGELCLPAKAYLGRPAHGVAFTRDGTLYLAPLSRPLDTAEQPLFQQGGVEVPSGDVDEFALRFLPRLRTRLRVDVDAGLDLPEPSPPHLLCRVEFRSTSASVHWGYRYRLGGKTIDVGLAANEGQPARDHLAEQALHSIAPDGPWKSAGELLPAFLTGRSLIEFVSVALPALHSDERVDVETNTEAPSYRKAEDAPEVRLSVGESPMAGDWFDLHIDITIDGEAVPLGDLMRALASGDDHLLLESGTWFDLDTPQLAELRQLIAEARLLADPDGEEDALRLRPEHAGLWDDLARLGIVTSQADSWRESVDALLDPATLPDEPVPAGLAAKLRPYQETGFRWLRFLWRARLGGILADEMGLGKTVQALAAAQAAFEAGELNEPMLVVAPTSVIGTWASEAARFAPGLKVVAVSATEAKRGEPLDATVGDAQIVITSYTLLRLEADAYHDLTWSAVLLDEAQFVKNHTAKAHHAVRVLNARVKVALTGTPLENNVMDLWSLLSITAPGLFPDPRAFTADYRRPIESGDEETLSRLRRRIRPLILRRTKAAVAAELPEKQEQLVPVELSPGHRRMYDRYLTRERQKVLGLLGDLQRNRITILSSLTMLRQLSLAPNLVDAQAAHGSAKIDALIEMLGEVVAEGHRALVFSQFTGFLALVRERFAKEEIAYEYLDGRTRDRAARIEAFREGDAPVFLISLKAGGFGLTLTEADYVFILDPWWNPATENQAIDRAHRIGQDKPVNVYRLVSSDTVEDKVVALQQRKRDLFDSVVGTGSDAGAPLSADDIMGLLGP